MKNAEQAYTDAVFCFTWLLSISFMNSFLHQRILNVNLKFPSVTNKNYKGGQSWPLPSQRQIAAGDGTFEEPAADGIDGRVAAIGEDDDADWVVRRETDPGAAVVAAAIFFEVAAVDESQRP